MNKILEFKPRENLELERFQKKVIEWGKRAEQEQGNILDHLEQTEQFHTFVDCMAQFVAEEYGLRSDEVSRFRDALIYTANFVQREYFVMGALSMYAMGREDTAFNE